MSHDSFDDAIIALRTAAAVPTDRQAIAAAKDAADKAQLHTLAVNYAAEQLAAIIREDERKALVDAARLKAAQELGVEPHELILVERDDEAEPIPPPPDGYAAAIRALQERERGR